MPNPAASAVKNCLPAFLKQPVPVIGKKLSGHPVFPAVRIRWHRNKRFFHEHINCMHAARRSMSNIILHDFPAQLGQDMMENPGAVYYVKLLIQPVIMQIRPEKVNLHLMDICQPLRLLNSGLRHIKCRYLISVSCKKDCVFPFPAAHLKQPQRPGGIASAQKLQTHFAGHSSPIIFLNFITLFIRRYRFLFRDISHQRVDIRLQKPRQCGKKRYVGQRLGIFPLGNSLGRDAQPLRQLLLGISPGFPESCNIFCQP